MESSYLSIDELRQDLANAEEHAKSGPVLISERGVPSLVLLNYEDYKALVRLARLPDLRIDEMMVSFMDTGESSPQLADTPDAGPGREVWPSVRPR